MFYAREAIFCFFNFCFKQNFQLIESISLEDNQFTYITKNLLKANNIGTSYKYFIVKWQEVTINLDTIYLNFILYFSLGQPLLGVFQNKVPFI